MDYLLTVLLSFIFIISLVVLKTKRKQVSKYRSYILIFLIVILFCLLGIAIYDVFTVNKKEQFGGGNKKGKLMNVCGLPKNYQATSHCFNDSTHHTCCMLGPKARKYADNSGNPIGTAAKKAFKVHKKRNAKDLDLTPWCTCFGSEVCSFYAKKFNDGTHIKLINDPNSGTDIAYKPSANCEGFFRDKFNVDSHGTPGVNKVENVNSNSCKRELSKIKNIFNLKKNKKQK